jgi:transcriptional regulator with XRE-family HTH domain
MVRTEEFNIEVGEALTTLRRCARISQIEMGKRLGIHRNSVRRYERGEGISALLFVKVCEATQSEPGVILGKVLHLVRPKF